MKKKILLIGIVAIVAVISVSGLGYVYMSGMMVTPDNNYYSSELEEEIQPEEEEEEAQPPQPTHQSPTASITASATSGDAPLTVEFIGSGFDADGYIATYHWYFGDSNVGDNYAFVSSTRHTYNQKGTYTVTFTITDDDGLYGYDSIQIEVFGPTILELNPTEDSYIELDEPDLNHGNDGSLYVTYRPGLYYHNEHISFLKFDISQIEPSATINNAVLKLYAWYTSTPGTINVHRCNDNSWSEDSITWNNAPSYTTGSEDSDYINSDKIWLEWDVTDYMTDMIPYNRMITFVLDIGGDEGFVSFESKDYSLVYRFPILEIEYE